MDTGESTYGYRGSMWIKRIVVAADGSPASSRGLEQVADLAPRVGAKVVVVFVRHLPPTAMMAPAMADSTMVQTLDEQEAGVRQEAVRALGGVGVDWEIVVRAGSPGEEIVQVADESGADLVVVGSTATVRCTTCSWARLPRTWQPTHKPLCWSCDQRRPIAPRLPSRRCAERFLVSI
jgi:nucleotide-binding universal stress UspA family protein